VAQTLEIGRSLRERRTELGLGLEAVESKTKIRARYLAALEAERFGELPGDAYARGFLRTYADHLGLDGQEVLAAYRARERLREELAPVSPRPQRPYEPRRLGPVLAGAATAVVLVVCSLAAWQLGGSGETATPPAQPPAAEAKPKPAVAAPTLVLAATRATRVEIRFGGPRGKLVWSGRLRPGRELRLGLRRTLWLQSSAPRRLRLEVAGRPSRMPAGAGSVLVTRRGVRAAA
jgi:Helix-turn-helix domain